MLIAGSWRASEPNNTKRGPALNLARLGPTRGWIAAAQILSESPLFSVEQLDFDYFAGVNRAALLARTIRQLARTSDVRIPEPCG